MKCANCGHERSDRYCAHCGQNDREYRRALPPLLGELIRETFEVDSRLWHTLKLLILKPGELALEFSRNRRASYVSPIRLYLFVSIAFFFLLSMTTDVTPAEDDGTVRLEVENVKAADTTKLLALLDPERQQRAREVLGRPDSSVAKLLLLEIAESVSKDDTLDRVEVYLLGQLVDALHEPGSVVGRFMDNLAMGIFVLLPVYAGLLKLFYVGQHRYYVEHLVFSTQLHTFTFLVFTLALLVSAVQALPGLGSAAGYVTNGLMLWIAVYHYLALRRYFGESRARTAIKFSFLMIAYTALLLPTAAVAVLAITLISL